MTDAKQTMRQEAARVRAALHLRGDEAEQAAERALTSLGPVTGQTIAIYIPIRHELDTMPLVDMLIKAGANLALPSLDVQKNTMCFRGWDGTRELIAGPYGIPAPDPQADEVLPDVVIVPLLAFDRRGNRLGYGGGHYDRILASLKAQKDVRAIGYAYAEQACLFPLPREDHDIRLDMVITPQGVHDFR